MIISLDTRYLVLGSGNYAVYLGVSLDNFSSSGVNSEIADWTPIRANYKCFMLFEYMDVNLDVYVPQDDYCVEIVC